MKVSINKTQSGGELRVYTREISGTQKTFLYISDSSVAIKEQNPTTVTKASASITTTANVWYDYHLVTEGSRMEVWRGPQGGPLEFVLETDALTNFETDSMMLLSLNGAQGKFDNVQFISHDPKSTTFAYNDANELTTMTEGGTTTTYTYDDWGRTISKSDGTHSATYAWRFGDKLNSYTTTFPGEANVFFNYDGLGKRRLKLLNPGASTDADYTWYRWDAAWNMIGEYAAGTDTGTTFDIGALTRWYTFDQTRRKGLPMSHVDGNPNLYDYKYYTNSHMDTLAGIYSEAKMMLAKRELFPYGEPLYIAGLKEPIVFAYHTLDLEINVYYAAFRYYNPNIGRWNSRDPLGDIDGPNLYSYAILDPVNNADDLGLAIEKLPAIMKARQECAEELECKGDMAFMQSYNAHSLSTAMWTCVHRKTGVEPKDLVKDATRVLSPKPRPPKRGKVSCGTYGEDNSAPWTDLSTVLLVFLLLLLRVRRRTP